MWNHGKMARSSMKTFICIYSRKEHGGWWVPPPLFCHPPALRAIYRGHLYYQLAFGIGKETGATDEANAVKGQSHTDGVQAQDWSWGAGAVLTPLTTALLVPNGCFYPWRLEEKGSEMFPNNWQELIHEPFHTTSELTLASVVLIAVTVANLCQYGNVYIKY